MKIMVYKEFEYFQFVTYLFQLNFSKKNKIKRLQLYQPCFAHNQSEKNIERVFGPIKPDKSLSFYVYEPIQVIMIDKDKDFIFAVF